MREIVTRNRGLLPRANVFGPRLFALFLVACGSNSGGGSNAGGQGLPEAGSSGGSGGAATIAGLSQACQALVQHQVTICGQSALVADQTTCLNATTLYAPQGCGNEWNAYLTCATTADIDCMKGAMGCSSQQSAYLQCQTQFVFATGCTRNTGDDAQCSGATPYAFLCTKLQATCVALPGGSATAACCAAFPPR